MIKVPEDALAADFPGRAGRGIVLLTAAQEPSVLTKASPGEWELSGVAGRQGAGA